LPDDSHKGGPAVAVRRELLWGEEEPRPETPASRAWGFPAALALGGVAAALLAVRLDVPALFDNEGRYAEVAREMLLRGDFITPTLDFTIFLNKPPLTFWLAALVHHLTGPSEWARLVSVAWAAVTLVATCRLGALLYGERVGLVAGALLAVTLGFVLEARTLRPDMAVAASVVLSLLAWRHAMRRPARDGVRLAWLVALYASLGVGMLAKGLVPLVLAAIPIGIVTLRERGWRGVLDLRPGLGLVVLGTIVLPWHIAIALRHPGFVSDYLVNQHLMTFFDKKPQNDTTGDPIWFFWTAFAGRMMPWIVLLPLTLDEARRGLGRVAEPAARATAYLWLWLGGLMLFFSLAPSRLEHYSVPALPAGALLAARVWQRGAGGQLGPRAWRMLVAVGVVVTAVGLFGIARGATLLSRTYWLVQSPGLLSFVPLAGAVFAAMGATMAFAAGRRQAGFLVGALGLAMIPFSAIIVRAEAEAEPLFSWRLPARAVMSAAGPHTEIVFEAPREYQLVAGLVFYSGRRVTLLDPPGFVPPDYLKPAMDGMFLSREEFARRWEAGESLILVSNPLLRREDPAEVAPGALRVLGRFGDRWILAPAGASLRR
jgi:4-amino-4-deoxy-L-arabinose transferase-like glycosyltransferase